MNQRLWPMLAVRGEPFDSPEYLFEVKWNGIRALAGRSHESQPSGGWDLWGRELADYRSRYPEMQVLAALPPGTILDGELVRLSQGLPDLEAILARHQLSHPAKIQHASRHQPVTYVVFDLLAHHGRSLVGQPLHERRALLQDLLARWQEPRVLFSEGIVGPGRVFFEQAVRQGQEGVMAKHLASRYVGETLFVLAQDQTRAAIALRHHGLGAWRPGAAWSLGGGAVGRSVALRCQRAHGVHRPGAAPLGQPCWRVEAVLGPWCVVRTGGCGWSRISCARSTTWNGHERAAYAVPASMACWPRRELTRFRTSRA